QPSAEGEALLVEEMLRMVPKEAETVADLFCGLGTFTFALAVRRHRVHAVEAANAPLAALWTAARRNDQASRITVEERDLTSRPIRATELEGGDAVVFDPPRAGARDQAVELAASEIPTIIAVSCNPATFARDARILTDGGYRLAEVTPIDQFPWSAHLELVAQFVRD
ncbi:MAG: methyltransferase, partial [Kiloniellales bacterium]|nr:methyltransferase [Kiloniellales bacterium]